MAETRSYRKTRRAAQEERTRRRITEAVVALHRTVGPAATTVTDVAARAGVTRTTVYHHFPREADLFRACSRHWAARHPFPDPSRWATIRAPGARLHAALRDLYSFYRGAEDMLGKVLRDAPTLPELARVVEGTWTPYLEEVVATLARGWPRRRTVRAALRVAVDFPTWSTLVAAGLSDRAAAEAAARMVAAQAEG